MLFSKAFLKHCKNSPNAPKKYHLRNIFIRFFYSWAIMIRRKTTVKIGQKSLKSKETDTC